MQLQCPKVGRENTAQMPELSESNLRQAPSEELLRMLRRVDVTQIDSLFTFKNLRVCKTSFIFFLLNLYQFGAKATKFILLFLFRKI